MHEYSRLWSSSTNDRSNRSDHTLNDRSYHDRGGLVIELIEHCMIDQNLIMIWSCPSLLSGLTSPRSRSIFTTLTCPFIVAWKSAVWAILVGLSGWTSLSLRSISATPACKAAMRSGVLPPSSGFSGSIFVKIFAKVPYHQHCYDTRCLDEESLGMDRVAGYGTWGDGCFVGRLAAAEMFGEHSGNVLGG